MNLSKQLLSRINPKGVEIPPVSCFDLPEKVLQFGTGVLLRALPDYFIDKANKKGFFNGRIVLVKSTDKGEASSFQRQDGLYTICVKGIVNGQKKEENIINASVSRVFSAREDWNQILACAANPRMEIVISNTTEVGIELIQDDIHAAPPNSFPGKLLSFLFERHRIFGGDETKGMVIIPTELIPGNGNKLKEILIALAVQNRLGIDFRKWLENANHFCNSLVDRIVPGKLPELQLKMTEDALGYQDELLIMAEPYRLWAIESANKKVVELLSFSQADPAVIIAPDISIFRELKLRLLNGSHTFSCGLAHLAGFITVREAMESTAFSGYIQTLMYREIIPCITNAGLTKEKAADFAAQVLDRYRNPFMEHLWLSITLQYGSKMRLRNVPLLLNYFERFGTVPEYMSLGFAAHLLFMKSEKSPSGQFYGEANGKPYLVNDEHAAYYSQYWKRPENLVIPILSDIHFWGTDLSKLPGFVEAVAEKLHLLMENGAAAVLLNMQSTLQSQ